MFKEKKIILVASTLLLIMGCSITIDTINKEKKKTNLFPDSELSLFANDYFWDNFHKGKYEMVDSVIFYLSAAYNENPNDLKTVSHLGFSHIWKISERGDLASIPPTIVDESTLAMKYFGESYRLNSDDPRILGFLADAKMTAGSISQDDKLNKEGYFNGLKSIRQWKSFNYFTVGYILSQLPHDSWQFKKGLEWQWKTIDACICEKMDRDAPDYTQYLPLEKTETDIKRKRACWNSWIAPHNFQGFFLNMGDMLVKSGDWKKAIQIYKLAQQESGYATWVYKTLLEDRILNAERNVEKFRKIPSQNERNDNNEVILINSSISCRACHHMSKEDQLVHQDYNWQTHLTPSFYKLKAVGN